MSVWNGRTTRRAVMAAAGSAAGAGALAACGTPSPATGPQSSGAVSGEVTWTSWATDELGMKRVGEQADLYSKEFPSAKVTVANVPSGNTYQDKLLSGLAAGSGPDVFRDNPSDAIPLITQGQLQELDPLFAKSKGTWWGGKDVKPGVMDWGKTRGHMYGLPMGTGAYYDFSINRNLYRSAGVPMPPKDYDDPKYGDWTFDRVVEDAKKLTKRGGAGVEQYGLDYPLSSYAYMMPIVTSWGGQIMDTKTGEFKWTDAAATDALQWGADLVQKHQVANTKAERATGVFNFEKGKLALTFSTPNLAMYLLSTVGDQFEWDLVPPPHLPGKKPVLWFYASWWVLNKASKVKDAAWNFTQWVGGPKGQRVEVEYAWTAPHFYSLDAAFGLRMGATASTKSLGVARDFGKVISQERPELNPRFSEAITTAIGPALDKILTGEMPAKAAMQQVKPQVDDLFKKGIQEDQAAVAKK